MLTRTRSNTFAHHLRRRCSRTWNRKTGCHFKGFPLLSCSSQTQWSMKSKPWGWGKKDKIWLTGNIHSLLLFTVFLGYDIYGVFLYRAFLTEHWKVTYHFHSLQCPFIDVCIEDLEQDKRFPTSLVKDALQQLVQSINHRAGFLNIYQSVIECLEPDIR